MCEFCKNIMPFSYGISTYSNMGIAIGDDIKPHIYMTTLNENNGELFVRKALTDHKAMQLYDLIAK